MYLEELASKTKRESTITRGLYPSSLRAFVLSRKVPVASMDETKRMKSGCAYDATGTFKFKKNALKEDGYNPRVIVDSLFVFDANSSKYIPLDRRLYEQIQSGVWRL
jgi:hypothetical protein